MDRFEARRDVLSGHDPDFSWAATDNNVDTFEDKGVPGLVSSECGVTEGQARAIAWILNAIDRGATQIESRTPTDDQESMIGAARVYEFSYFEPLPLDPLE